VVLLMQEMPTLDELRKMDLAALHEQALILNGLLNKPASEFFYLQSPDVVRTRLDTIGISEKLRTKIPLIEVRPEPPLSVFIFVGMVFHRKLVNPPPSVDGGIFCVLLPFEDGCLLSEDSLVSDFLYHFPSLSLQICVSPHLPPSMQRNPCGDNRWRDDISPH